MSAIPPIWMIVITGIACFLQISEVNTELFGPTSKDPAPTYIWIVKSILFDAIWGASWQHSSLWVSTVIHWIPAAIDVGSRNLRQLIWCPSRNLQVVRCRTTILEWKAWLVANATVWKPSGFKTRHRRFQQVLFHQHHRHLWDSCSLQWRIRLLLRWFLQFLVRSSIAINPHRQSPRLHFICSGCSWR